MLLYNLISIQGQRNPSIRQVWVCQYSVRLSRASPSMTQSPSPQVPATLSALAQPSALGSPAALLPWNPPGSLLSLGLRTCPLLSSPRTLGRLLFCQRPLPPTLGKAAAPPCFSLFPIGVFFPHVCIQTLYYSIDLLRCLQPSECQPSETGGLCFSHCGALLSRAEHVLSKYVRVEWIHFSSVLTAKPDI